MSNTIRYKIEDCFYLRARIGWQGLRFDEFTDKGPYLVTGTDFVNGEVDWDTCYHVTERRYRQDTGIQLREHDLLITKDGTIGKTAIVQNCPEKVTLNSGIFVVRAINGNVVPQFLYYILNSHQFYWFMRNMLTGSTIKHLNQEHFYKFSFEAPDTESQRKIAAVLNAADKAITKSRALVEKYTAIKQGLMQDLLMNGISDDGRIRSQKIHEYKSSDLGSIPNEWDCVSIGDIAIKVGSGATPRGGQDVYTREGVLFIRSQNVTFDGLFLDDVAYIDEQTNFVMNRSQIETSDVLLNITGASLGRCCIYDLTVPANVNQHVCIIRTNMGSDFARFLCYWLSSFGQRQINSLIVGSNREGLNFSQVKAIKLPLIHNKNELKKIISTLEAQDERLTAEKKRLAKLEKIKRGLMDDLLTNRVSTDTLERGQEYA